MQRRIAGHAARCIGGRAPQVVVCRPEGLAQSCNRAALQNSLGALRTAALLPPRNLAQVKGLNACISHPGRTNLCITPIVGQRADAQASMSCPHSRLRRRARRQAQTNTTPIQQPRWALSRPLACCQRQCGHRRRRRSRYRHPRSTRAVWCRTRRWHAAARCRRPRARGRLHRCTARAWRLGASVPPAHRAATRLNRYVPLRSQESA